MVITLETPLRHTPSAHPFAGYADRFGSLPLWLDDLPADEARYLARRALRTGTPLPASDCERVD